MVRMKHHYHGLWFTMEFFGLEKTFTVPEGWNKGWLPWAVVLHGIILAGLKDLYPGLWFVMEFFRLEKTFRDLEGFNKGLLSWGVVCHGIL